MPSRWMFTFVTLHPPSGGAGIAGTGTPIEITAASSDTPGVYVHLLAGGFIDAGSLNYNYCGMRVRAY